MGMARPIGEYAERMLEPGGWPQVDEDAFYDRARQYLGVLRQVTDVMQTCQQQQGEIFNGGMWSGGAADAADGELGAHIDQLMRLQDDLATVVSWHNHVGRLSVQTKLNITDSVEAAHNEIRILHNDPALSVAERTAAIHRLVSATHDENVSTVAGMAAQISASDTWKPPKDALRDLLAQKAPPQSAAAAHDPRQPARAAAAPGGGGRSAQVLSAAPGRAVIQQPARAASRLPAQSPWQSAELAGGGPAPVSSSTPADAVRTPRDTAPPPAPPPGEPSQGLGAIQMTAQSWGSTGAAKSPQVTPAAATGGAPMPEAASAESVWHNESVPGADGAGLPLMGGAAPAGGAASGAASGREASATAPLTPARTTPAPAASPDSRAAPRARPAAHPRSNAHDEPAEAGPSASMIPVSPTRAARDAISAGFAGRGKDRTDPLRLARHLAAALNAPAESEDADVEFFWITAVTADAKIVVANSVGLAYLPDHVQLPNGMHLATADATIPAAERARWATHPLWAVQGWATHHHTQLRAVIGTDEQLADSDPGAATIVLHPDDIPDTATMTGRPRLQVVDPATAAQLIQTSDLRLLDLLPTAPAATIPPKDQRHILWLEMMEPLASSAPGHEAAHLQAFHTYAAHAQEISRHQAHIAADPASQRTAVADWLYWRYVADLLDHALPDTNHATAAANTLQRP